MRNDETVVCDISVPIRARLDMLADWQWVELILVHSQGSHKSISIFVVPHSSRFMSGPGCSS